MTWFGGVFRTRRVRWVALALLFYGILIELLQSRLPYRQAEAADVESDLCGILLGWILVAIGLRHWTVKKDSVCNVWRRDAAGSFLTRYDLLDLGVIQNGTNPTPGTC